MVILCFRRSKTLSVWIVLAKCFQIVNLEHSDCSETKLTVNVVTQHTNSHFLKPILKIVFYHCVETA